MELVAALAAAAVRMELVAALAAAAVRMQLAAALARPAQTDRSCRNQGSRRSANGAGCCPRRRSANAPACCPRSTCSDRPQPLQCECTCLLPLLDLLRQTGLDLLGQTAAAAAVRLLRQTVALQPRQPPQCEWSTAVRMHLPAAFARPAQTDRSRCSASAPACCPCSTCS